MKTPAKNRAKLCIAVTFALFASSHLNALTIADVWINEFHYDNNGADEGEFVEIAGIANTDLSNLILEFYRSDGTVYDDKNLTGSFLGNSGNGYGAKSFLVSGIQNGGPKGIALAYGTTLLQFISYQGSLTASEGSANGETSTDIGVKETGSTPEGFSLQFLGKAGEGIWLSPSIESPGELNLRQNFGVPDSVHTLGLLGFAALSLCLYKRKTRYST